MTTSSAVRRPSGGAIVPYYWAIDNGRAIGFAKKFGFPSTGSHRRRLLRFTGRWWLPRWLDRLVPDVRFGH